MDVGGLAEFTRRMRGYNQTLESRQHEFVQLAAARFPGGVPPNDPKAAFEYEVEMMRFMLSGLPADEHVAGLGMHLLWQHPPVRTAKEFHDFVSRNGEWLGPAPDMAAKHPQLIGAYPSDYKLGVQITSFTAKDGGKSLLTKCANIECDSALLVKRISWY
eukprot:TRINITY_DN9475_c0_g1_i2.p1 TRINITY_DN9475_c0_g1~~TRINITY_DN9475_c0_g1_i2.p1  ORF type:complete len:160 (+),score=29.27 TRINITY_DN9475_c0_g1_i2:173-652(+)